ncbi:MAG: nuclear transport factor 2 family protein [Actinomycetota bacterium]|nr:nuclear transport factor 2 family protein [Actinomycetota bacterium]
MNKDLQELVDEKACEKLIAEYCHLVDFGNASAIADLFTVDGYWSGPGVEMVGQDQIRAGFSARQEVARRQSRHLCTNVLVSVEEDEATSLCYLLNFRHDSLTGIAESPAPAGLPKYVGEYHDRFVRTAEGWRFASRRCELAFLRE